MYKLKFLRVLNSPFKPFRLRWYCGKTSVGTPYFLPRKWVKYTKKDAEESAIKSMNDPNKVKKTFEEWVESYKNYSKAVPKKIGFDLVELGWKTKWGETDYRFEYSPRLSFVFFGYQIAIIVDAIESDRYWEAWLYYENHTDHKKSKKERIIECIKEFPLNFVRYSQGEKKEEINYYNYILKNKYLNLIKK